MMLGEARWNLEMFNGAKRFPWRFVPFLLSSKVPTQASADDIEDRGVEEVFVVIDGEGLPSMHVPEPDGHKSRALSVLRTCVVNCWMSGKCRGCIDVQRGLERSVVCLGVCRELVLNRVL